MRPLSTSFRYDAVLMEITSTEPADGSLAVLPLTSVELHFDEPFDRSSVETSDLVTEGKHTYLVARVSSATVNTLAAFEAEGEDREADADNEADDDGEPDCDDEPSLGSSAGGTINMTDLEHDTADDEPDHDSNNPKPIKKPPSENNSPSIAPDNPAR